MGVKETHLSNMRAYLLLLAIAAAVEASHNPCPLVGGNGLAESEYADPVTQEYLTNKGKAPNLPCATTLEEVQVAASADDGHHAVATAKKAVMKTKKDPKKFKKTKKAAKKTSNRASKKKDMDALKSAGVDPTLMQFFEEPVAPQADAPKKLTKMQKADQEYQQHIDAVDMLF